jgi:hypothetical protein
LANVPIVAPLEVTETVSTAVELLLEASTRSSRFDPVYSARVIETESGVAGGVAVGAGVGAGAVPFTPRLVLFVAPPPVPVSVTSVFVLTAVVVTVKFTKLDPAGMFTLAGTLATTGLLLVRLTANPPAGAGVSIPAVPCVEVPPFTVDGKTVMEVSGGGALAAGLMLSTAGFIV